MRTRWHTPALEEAMRLLGKAGNNGAVWLAIDARAGDRSTPATARRG